MAIHKKQAPDQTMLTELEYVKILQQEGSVVLSPERMNDSSFFRSLVANEPKEEKLQVKIQELEAQVRELEKENEHLEREHLALLK